VDQRVRIRRIEVPRAPKAHRQGSGRDLANPANLCPPLRWAFDGVHHRALQLAGITRETPDPPGATFERDVDGRPNGILTELAATDTVFGPKPAPDYDEQVKRLASLNEHFLERGIVAVNDLLATFVPTPLQMFRDAARAGLLPQWALYYGWTDLQANPVPDLTDEDRTGRMKVAGMKLFMDGAYSNRTAWTNDPYPNSTDHGMRTLADETVREAVGGLGATASRSPSTPWATGP
jgi:predicted amidohydrolase YtcJ